MLRINALLFVLAFAALLHAAPPASAAPPCTFTLGFAALHDQIGDFTGDCLEDAHALDNGDVVQATEVGLMSWHKADNFAAFYTGEVVWALDPCGLADVTRNGTPFPWQRDGSAAPTC